MLSPATDVSTLVNDDDKERETEAYWTVERMRAALPAPMPNPTEAQRREIVKRFHATQTPSIPRLIPSSDAARRASDEPTRPDPKKRPYWNVGKAFWRASDGTDRVGSMGFVGNKTVLLTAAHCVFDAANEKWFDNFKFVRAYSNGGGQNVRWNCMAIWQGYYANKVENWPLDYAFVKLRTNGVGWLGFATGLGGYTSATSVGYPTNYGNQKYMYASTGAFGTIGGGTVQMKDNPMGPGCSGGPWIADVSQRKNPSANIACGVNSHKYDADPNSVYSPLFDDDTWNLFQFVDAAKCRT